MMSAINNQYLSRNADPQRVNECVLRTGSCLHLKLSQSKFFFSSKKNSPKTRKLVFAEEQT